MLITFVTCIAVIAAVLSLILNLWLSWRLAHKVSALSFLRAVDIVAARYNEPLILRTMAIHLSEETAPIERFMVWEECLAALREQARSQLK
jgi:hypothetical protein